MPRLAVLTTLKPKSPSVAGSSVMPTAPLVDCARSDPPGEPATAVSRPADTPPSSGFVSLSPHAARARTRSTRALAPSDFATIAERRASMPPTSFGRVPPAEHPPPRQTGHLLPNLP